MEELLFRPCALKIERSFYTQSKHDKKILSYALVVLKLVATAAGQLHQLC